MFQRFYMVWVDGVKSAAPAVRHTAYDNAEAEAERLTTLTRSPAYILQSVARAMPPTEVKWEHPAQGDIRNDL